MRTLLVITKQSSLASAVASALDPQKFQIITKEAVGEAEFLLSRGAIDASRSGAQIHVHLDRLARPGETDWLRVRVVDQGEGIPKENLSRILTPYFTTKNRGDENRGFGLGLAICRKIVNLHGGKLSIASVVKRGTTVQVDIPARQPRPATTTHVAVPA